MDFSHPRIHSNMGAVGINPTTVMNPIANIMDVMAERQKVVGHNIANVNTPGYLAQDLPFKDILSRKTNPFETRLSQELGRGSGEQDTVSTGQPVNLHQEFLKLQENMLFYNMATRRMTSIITNLRTASQIGR